MKRLFFLLFIALFLSAFSISCSNPNATQSTNDSKTALAIMVLGDQFLNSILGSGTKPVLNELVITKSDSSSITLAQPTLSNPGTPAPTLKAFIGVSGDISDFYGYIYNSVEGPIDVSSGGYKFSGLATGITYTIYVVASNSTGYSVQHIIQNTAGIAPVMNNLSISASDTSSITLAQPSFSTAGNPAPTVQAYIGASSSISVSAKTVSGSILGPIDVSSGGCQFTSLSTNMTYTIIVVAANSIGYSVQQIVQSTTGIAPVLNSLSISTYDATSITLAKPTFSTTGNPVPAVGAYIGKSGVISVSNAAISGSLQGPIDVSSGSYQFSGLSANTSYTIIVVAINSAGYSVQQIIQSTSAVTVAPVLNSLSISASDSSSITLAKPTFSTTGNPTPTVQAYIGAGSSISVSGKTVSGSLQGPIDVSSGSYQFSGLSANTSYKIIVVAANSAGYSVQQITQSTATVAPVLNSLSISAYDSSSITLTKPTFSAGNPTPTVQAYIGYNGTISVSGSTVSNSLKGPIDVSTGSYQFSGLNDGTSYKIIVVATNSAGYSVQQITQSTASAPIHCWFWICW
jgi:hypothetical protein